MRRIIVPAVVALSLAVAGCATAPGGTAHDRTAEQGTEAGAASAPGQGTIGLEAAGLAPLTGGRTTLTDEQFDVAAVAERPVVLWFWAPWCTICRAEAPDIVEVAEELEAAGSPVVLLGVPGRGQVAAMADFVADTRTGAITHVVDDDGTIWREFGAISQPAFAFIGTDGAVDVVNGALGADGLRERTSRLASG